MEYFEIKAEQDQHGWWYTAYRMEWDGSQFVKAGGWMMNGPSPSEHGAYAMARADISERFDSWCAW